MEQEPGQSRRKFLKGGKVAFRPVVGKGGEIVRYAAVGSEAGRRGILEERGVEAGLEHEEGVFSLLALMGRHGFGIAGGEDLGKGLGSLLPCGRGKASALLRRRGQQDDQPVFGVQFRSRGIRQFRHDGGRLFAAL